MFSFPGISRVRVVPLLRCVHQQRGEPSKASPSLAETDDRGHLAFSCVDAAIVHRAERTHPPAADLFARCATLLACLQRYLFGKGNSTHAVAIATVIEEMQLTELRFHLCHHDLRNVGVSI
ncbi:hypothetical protein WR25_00425 [Diploscapter pachys]|uniref:Uncharacterized protein n=1 Tax=Diploscapter pachys TaxID=2018661 RepID=A0A2A2JW97_9BILA|nr:hypothetical protein WR25_00425 [Diploscapter pachys]